MANYWVITIGINQYRHFQPLVHAQNDALYLHRFFTQEAGIPAAQCVLLSDLSTSVGEQIVYPDKPTIAEWIQTITHQVQTDDVLWVFFSGYGAQLRRDGDGSDEGSSDEGNSGDQSIDYSVDYLMPIDGDPEHIESTGIAATELIDTLAGLPTDKTLLVLDINRSQGTLSGQSIGAQVVDLAEKRQVPTLLSCQPEQYSHGRIFGLRPGLFTSALLEALQQNCQTLEQISTYLDKRLPELCIHHLRPVQNPVCIVASDRKSLTVVPDISRELAAAAVVGKNTAEERQGDSSNVLTTGALATAGVAASSVAASSVAASSVAASAVETSPLIQPPYTEETTSTGSYRDPESLHSRRDADPDALAGVDSSGVDSFKNDLDDQSDGAANEQSQRESKRESELAISGARLRNWGLLTLAILMGGVLLKQPFVGAAWNRLTNRTEVAVEDPSAEDESSALETADADGAQAATSSADPTAASGSEGSGGEGSGGEGNGVAATGTNSATAAEEAAAAQAFIEQANAALAQRQYAKALTVLQQVPQSQRDEKFSALLTEAKAGDAEAKQTNASVLADARQSIQPTQASQFTQAIAKARLIQPGEPSYEAAQRDIRSWSQVILDIAEGRATSGNLEGAIAAAGVMPYDIPEYRQKAQDKIAFWQQRQQSRNIIAAAQAIPKLGEASTYQKGIVKLREVPIEHPEYEIAQRLADQWSESIFSIAQARAAQGREAAAIQAAVLVPAGTIAYEPTQQAIRRWQSGG